jgi:hypothetical protein
MISASTVLHFENPTQAGWQEWPAVVVEGEVPEGAEGFINEGDYTEFIKQKIADEHPEAWTGVEYETGPRSYTFTESIVLESTTAPKGLALLGLESTVTDEILMGFTVLGPDIDYSISFDLDICIFWFFGCVIEVELVDFWAGVELDWTIGTRLPMALSITSDAPVLEGTTFTPTTAATGVDWDAPDYEAAGVSPEEGNEFVLEFYFKAGVFLEVLYVDLIDLGVEIDIDEASSFATPLGPGATFDLPSVAASLWGFDVVVASADVGLTLTPAAGSDKYTASWQATAAGSGSGNVEYTTSGEQIALGSVQAVDGPGNAAVALSGFRYYFNQFTLDLGVYFTLSVLGYGSTWNIPIADFDLSALTGGLYVNPHAGTPSTLDLLIEIENVAPTVAISEVGTVMINGVPTFMAAPDQTLTLTGTASDPGRDDLTLHWDWDDGDPTPDVSTFYEVPYEVTESQSTVFTDACVYHVGLWAVDDDLGMGADYVPVLVSGMATNTGRLEGYWQHQLGRMGRTDFDDTTLECYLGIVDHMSMVFGMTRDISSIAAAHGVLAMKKNGGDPREQLDRELMVLWLNFAHGAIGLTDLVDSNGDGVPDTEFGAMMALAEARRMNHSSPDKMLRTLTRILHLVSVDLVN